VPRRTDRARPHASPPLPPFERLGVLSAAAAVALALACTLGAYGYHRDELYFRMLRPAWGYTDQPPLTPLIVHGISRIWDTVEAIRVPPLLLAVASVIVVALIAREAGGSRAAQALAAWGYGFGAFTLLPGHVFLTSSVDLVVWPLVVLAVVRAQLRGEPRWWLLAGLVAGLSLYNKLLVAVLIAAIGLGLLVVGPRRVLLSPWALGALGLAVLIGVPNLVYQVVNGFPQLALGAALSADNAGSVRAEAIPFLALLIGPPLVPFWVAGLVVLIRRPALRPIRFLAVSLLIAVVFVVVAGTQFYYEYGLLAAVFAIGCVPVAEFARTRARRILVVAAVALTGAVNILISLPVVPVDVLGATPIPVIDQAARDQVGWPRYVAQVEGVARRAPAGAVVFASNYGEAGALERFAPALHTYADHNALQAYGPPPSGTRSMVVVGYEFDTVRPLFASCAVEARLDDGVGVDNEEQGAPVAVCTRPLVSMATFWNRAAHLG